MNYRYGNKAQWRRWVWNRIAERRPRSGWGRAPALFLAGADALDVPVAASKGIDQRDMIAVERDVPTVDKLRSQGVLTIKGSLEEVLLQWPIDRRS